MPGDETFYHPSGIRMGVQEMTRFGMKETDFDNLSRLIADIVLRKRDAAEEVAAFRSGFSTMEYCLNTDQTLRIAPKLLESIFSEHDRFLAFAGSLKTQ